jgi:hypothetical protein
VGSGALPNGLLLNASTGAVTGTPTTTGAFTIDVKDAANTVAATGCPFTVGKASPVISWTSAPILIGSKLGAAQLDATANVPGKFIYTPPSGTEVTTPTKTLKVVFTPTDTADYTTATMTVSLEVTTIKVSPTSLNFGTVYLDSIVIKSVTVENLGTEPVTIDDPLISVLTEGDSREFVAFNLCPKSLAAHKSCTMKVQYVGGPFYNRQDATLSVVTSSPGSPELVSLTALTIDPQAQFNPTSLTFAAQKEGTSSTDKPVTLTNTGATSLTIDSIEVTGSDPLDFIKTNHCPSSLGAGLSCTIDFAFKPKAKGMRTAKLVVTDNAKGSTQSIPLSGTGD